MENSYQQLQALPIPAPWCDTSVETSLSSTPKACRPNLGRNGPRFDEILGSDRISFSVKNIEKPLDIYTNYQPLVQNWCQLFLANGHIPTKPQMTGRKSKVASSGEQIKFMAVWFHGNRIGVHGFSSPFPKSKGLVGFDHLWPSCPSQVWASVGKVQDETANGHGASPWHQKKIQRLCRTDNLESWTMAIPLWLWWCGDASADATVIFRLIVSMILIMSIVMMMMMVVVYQCLLMVINVY